MTPQELDLLAAMSAVLRTRHARLLPRRNRADGRKLPGSRSGRPSAKRFSNAASELKICRAAKSKLKFSRALRAKIASPKSPALQAWSKAGRSRSRNSESSNPQSRNPQFHIVACANPEAEAVFAAREILKFVRAGNRFRDCAVLVRKLDGYHKPLARDISPLRNPVFSRPPRIRRASPARRTDPQRASHRRIRLAAGRLVRRAQSRVLPGGRNGN